MSKTDEMCKRIEKNKDNWVKFAESNKLVEVYSEKEVKLIELLYLEEAIKKLNVAFYKETGPYKTVVNSFMLYCAGWASPKLFIPKTLEDRIKPGHMAVIKDYLRTAILEQYSGFLFLTEHPIVMKNELMNVLVNLAEHGAMEYENNEIGVSTPYSLIRKITKARFSILRKYLKRGLTTQEAERYYTAEKLDRDEAIAIEKIEGKMKAIRGGRERR